MKKIILLTFIYVLSTSVIHGQNCEVTNYLSANYERDVKHLALLRMELFNAPELESIEISEIWQDTIWEGLAAIYNSESIGRDQVFDQYCIHQDSWNSPDYNRVSNSIIVQIDTSVSWFQNWEDGDITTSDPFLDSIFLQYGFDRVSFLPATSDLFVLYTDEYLNLEVLVDLVETNEHVIYSEKVIDGGDYSEITYDYVDGEKYFDFTLGWGDCPAGCTQHQTWSFKVDQFCNVTFLGVEGDEGIPEPINCNGPTSIENKSVDSKYNIYPNPFTDKISVYSSEGFSSKKYILWSAKGTKILEGHFLNNEISNLEFLSPGVYFLVLVSEDGQRAIHKIVKW